jgi:hypothetical protein
MQQFLVDANVFVAAIKSPGKKTRSLDLIIEIISNQGIHLVGNDLLLLNSTNMLKNLNLKPHRTCSKG